MGEHGKDYRPVAGDRCLISPPNCDDENGLVFVEFHVLWCNETFILYGTPGCWPNLHKWEHVACKPAEGASCRPDENEMDSALQRLECDNSLNGGVMAYTRKHMYGMYEAGRKAERERVVGMLRERADIASKAMVECAKKSNRAAMTEQSGARLALREAAADLEES